MTACCFIEPIDVLCLRGNRLFGDPGSHAEALMPPWPSVAAGALRSRMLVDDGIDPGAFARGEANHPHLGSPGDPGAFVLAAFAVAHLDGERVQALRPLPADLFAAHDGEAWSLHKLQPAELRHGVCGSLAMPLAAALSVDQPRKPETRAWITDGGWRRYLAGDLPADEHVVCATSIWRSETRIGVGLAAKTRSAEEGRLFASEVVALEDGYGFLAVVEGASPPTGGLVRFGGDGRACRIVSVEWEAPEPDYAELCAEGRCRIVLTSPGIFDSGWLPGTAEDGRFALGGITGRIVCAAVGKPQVVSGWDLARRTPKPAMRAAPTGSVYWLDDLQAEPEDLRKLAAHGLWPAQGYDAPRRAEGFNRFTFARF